MFSFSAVAPLTKYLELLDRYAITRGVLVQPSVYGSDNRCLLDALDRAEGRLVGIAIPDRDSTAQELEAMHRHGVRGVRCNLLNPGGLDLERVIGWGPVLRDLGWCVQLHVAVEATDVQSCCDRLGVPVVIDHMGRPRPGRIDPSQPGLQQLIRLVEQGACYVKLTAPYRVSTVAPPWPDVAPLAHAFLAANAAH